MSTISLIQDLENYFGGKYTEGQRTSILVYLQSKNESYLKFLYKILTEEYSAQFKTPPALKEMKDSHLQVMQYLDHEAQKQKQIEMKNENRLLIEGTVTGNTIMVNGEQVHIGQYLLHVVADCCAKGRNPKHDPEVKRIYAIVESRSR